MRGGADRRRGVTLALPLCATFPFGVTRVLQHEATAQRTLEYKGTLYVPRRNAGGKGSSRSRREGKENGEYES